MKDILDRKLTKILINNNIAGMSVAVTDSEKTVYSGGFGVLSVERSHIPTPADALYRVASVTKMVTGLMIMKLCENSVLNRDTPIGEYVPWLRLKDDVQKEITLTHLLSHTSGLPAEYTPDGPREESALEASLKNELSKVALVSAPCDKKYLYSNLGIRLASYIAEQKTGTPYSILAKEYVLDPLDMTKSTYDLRVAATYDLSLPHDEAEGKLIPQHYIKENAARLSAGGLYSNIYDLSKLARCIINDGKADSGIQIVSKKTMDTMKTPISGEETPTKSTYGLTLMQKSYSKGTLTGHLGNADPYATAVLTDCERGLGVICLMNTFRSALRWEIPEMILETI